MRRGQAQAFSFSLEDPLSPGSRKAGLTWSAGQVKVSKDGAAGANTTNLPAAVSGMPAGVYSLSLTSTEMDAGHLLVAVDHPSAQAREFDFPTDSNGAPPTGVVVTDAGNTATAFKTDRGEATNDYWKFNLLTFVSGTLAGQVQKISGYAGATKIVTLAAALTGTPTAGDRFILTNT